LKDGNHREGHVGWSASWSGGAKSEVHVEECGGVALEPAGLEGDGAASYGPEGAVCGCGHAAAWEEGVLVGGVRRVRW